MCMEGPREKGVDPVVPPVTGGVITECPPYYTRGPKGTCIVACDTDLLFDAAEKKFAEVRRKSNVVMSAIATDVCVILRKGKPSADKCRLWCVCCEFYGRLKIHRLIVIYGPTIKVIVDDCGRCLGEF